MSNIYVGIDLSITSPGISILCDDSVILLSYSEHIKQNIILSDQTHQIILIANTMKYSKEHAFQRTKHNAEKIVELINNLLINLKGKNHIEFWMEGYSYGATGMIFNIAEMGGIVKYMIEKEYQTRINVIAPSTSKKFATGKGNATKEAIGTALITSNNDLGKLFSTIANKIKGKSKKNFIFESPINDLTDAYYISKYAEAQKDK